MTFLDILETIDGWVWGPVMLVILVGTGIFLTVRTKFLPWRNLGYAIKSTLSKEARTTHRGTGDVSPFACLCTALAATIDRYALRLADQSGLRHIVRDGTAFLLSC